MPCGPVAVKAVHDHTIQEAPREVELIVFELGGRAYAFTIVDVVEVLHMVALTPVPAAPPWLAGVLNLRGELIPVIDARVRLHLPAPQPGLHTPIIVGKVDGRGLGLIVDAVTGMQVLPQSAVTRLETWAGPRSVVTAIGRVNERQILILDLPTLAATDELVPLPTPGSVAPMIPHRSV